MISAYAEITRDTNFEENEIIQYNEIKLYNGAHFRQFIIR